MRPKRCVLVGCGAVSRGWLKALTQFDDVELLSLVDLDLETARNTAEELGLRLRTDTNLSAVLSDLTPDVVFDCTVPDAHPEVDCEAMEAGAHVLTEKPLGSSLDAALRSVETARKTNRLHAVMQNYRYDPRLERFRATLRSDVIGTIHTLHADFLIGARFGGFRAEMEHVLLLDMAIHTFDVARYLLGTRPVSVMCTEWNPESSWYRTGASAVATFTMETGAIFTYRGSWCAEGLNTSWNSSWRAVGTGGSAAWDGEEAIAVELPTPSEELIRPVESGSIADPVSIERSGHSGCIREFLDAIDNGTEPMTVSHDNIYSLAMSLAGARSAESGRVEQTGILR